MLSSLLLALGVVSLARAAQFNVTVGGGPLKYDPQFVNANPGDTIIFTFKQSNHTATQSTLAQPCVKASNGFDSGYMPVSASNTNGPFPAAQFTVQDMNPVWVYCKQGNHCQQGMVFAINPGTQFAAFQAAAMGNTTASSSSLVSTTATPTGVVTATMTATGGGQTSSTPTSGTSTDHKVVVGGSTLTYTPSNITAQVGDTVTFQFMQKNHTATQSTFANPCRALTLTSTSGQVGFDSGFMAVASNATTFPTYTVKVNDTAPIWVYCKQSGHCGQGMVFSVNAVESGPNNYAAFKAQAIQLNGTSSSTTSTGAQATQTKSGGVVKMNDRGTSVLVGLMGVVAGMFLA
jgi:plastocyanin